MATTSYVRSLMEFNIRVLSQGDIPVNKKSINAGDLKQLLFFNSVFIGNTTEMYQRHDMTGFHNEYVEALNRYIHNVSWIINAFNEMYPDTCMSMEADFEGRLASSDIGIRDQIIHGTYDSIGEFNNDTIYFFSSTDTNGIVVSYIDPKRSAYHTSIKNVNNDMIVYYKTDYMIKDEIELNPSIVDTVAVRFTTDRRNGKITKIEYHGNSSVMRSFIHLFPRDCFIVSNPFIYLDDIMRMIESKIPSKDTEKPIPVKFNFNDVFLKDKLVEFPNDSFDEYLQFLDMASTNPYTKAIYLTLYRIGKDPAIFYILRKAVNNGIDVHVNIELMASGEDINQVWLREMMNAGIKVTIYECGHLKVHCKLTVIEFNNGRILTQVGTGNYHTKTTSQYTDLCLITSDTSIGNQAISLFDIFDFGNPKRKFDDDFLVTRYNAKQTLIDLISEEAKLGTKGYILIKCNALDDPDIIWELENARNKGCYIYAIIRGVCTWVPGGCENVIIKSVVWDKLEHSRVYCFGRSNPHIYLGSLDLVSHKLDKRIETLVRVTDPDICCRICEYINSYATNSKESWIQTSSGMYLKEGI